MADGDGHHFISDYKGHKLNRTVICFNATMTTSSGIWLGDHPLSYSFPVLLAQLILIFFSTRLVHALLSPLGLPLPISNIITGMILGRSGLCRSSTFSNTFFPMFSWIHLDHISLLAFILFIFVVAVKTDLSLIRKSGRKAAAIAQLGTALPFLVIFVATFSRPNLRTDVLVIRYILHFAGRWSLTSYIVISSLLAEFKLLTSKLGRLAISASLFADFYSVIISTVFLFLTTCVFQSFFLGISFLLSFCGFLGAIWLFARPVVIWIIRRTPEGSAMDEAFFLTVLLMAIGLSIAGELIGQNVTLGPLLLGLIIPGGPPLGTAVADRLDRLLSAVFLPVFFIIAGLRSNIDDVFNGELWLPMTFLIFISVVAKFVGVILPCLYCRMPFRDAFVLALILNSRGIIEISTFNNLEDFNKMSAELYTVNILGIIVVGGATAIMLKALYRPSTRLVARRRRTVQACAGSGELRVLTCVHCEDHVPPLLTFIDAMSPTPSSPLCIYLLHLSPLAGRSNAILAPYENKQRSKSTFRTHSAVTGSVPASAATVSDRIVNSFLSLEHHHPAGLLTIQPFIGVSPYATMHDDIISLAADKMVDLIILPFHRRIEADVSLYSVNPAVRSVNANVLLYAPCSVAILVNRGFTGGPECVRHVAVFFVGGADDREALAVAERMAENPFIGLHVLRFVLPDGGGEVEGMDEAAVEEFQARIEGVETVEYREEVVREGAETVGVMREMSEMCGLLIVGRGEGRVSPLIAGLEMWNEYPELGVIGDILAAPDFGGKVSVMVVQQRAARVAAAASGEAGAAAGLLKNGGSRQGSQGRRSMDLKNEKLDH